jgi:hypothetical protein
VYLETERGLFAVCGIEGPKNKDAELERCPMYGAVRRDGVHYYW